MGVMANRRAVRPRRVYIGDRQWRIVRVDYPRDREGDCNWQKRTIRVHQSMSGLALMDVMLHEILHARLPDLSEECVEEVASTAAAILDAEGFRQADDHEE